MGNYVGLWVKQCEDGRPINLCIGLVLEQIPIGFLGEVLDLMSRTANSATPRVPIYKCTIMCQPPYLTTTPSALGLRWFWHFVHGITDVWGLWWGHFQTMLLRLGMLSVGRVVLAKKTAGSRTRMWSQWLILRKLLTPNPKPLTPNKNPKPETLHNPKPRKTPNAASSGASDAGAPTR